jgi:hypothetical protein
MLPVQDFAIRNIYCAPAQDKQFSFSLVRVNSVDQPVTNKAVVYNLYKQLPNANKKYHVFTIGQLDPSILNLFKQSRNWFRDVWTNVAEDMVTRDYIFKMYNQDGVKYPNEYIYYSFVDERSLILCLEFDITLESSFPIETFEYISVYSNTFFNSSEYFSLPSQIGIDYRLAYVQDNQDKLNLQNFITDRETNGGKAIVYVNGLHTNNLTLAIPDFSYVEVVYDQSIISKESYPLSELRTFSSTKDNKVKYFLHRPKIIDRIQYEDDNEIYISDNASPVSKGLYYYQHQEYAIRNVTDKDYSLNTSFIVNTVNALNSIVSGTIQDKHIVIYTRKSGLARELIYSSLKLHELYKLPLDIQLNTLIGTGSSLTDFRVETLEDSDYFKLAESKLKDITEDLCARVLGYNAITYYFANSPIKLATNSPIVDVPLLYQSNSTVFEYDTDGKLINTSITSGPVYPIEDLQAKYVEFIYGTTPADYGSYYVDGDTFTLLHDEYRIIAADFSNTSRISEWVDITDDQSKVSISNDIVSLTLLPIVKAKVIYANQPNIYTLDLPIVNGMLDFPLTINEDRGTGLQTFPIDIPYRNIEIYLNGYKLTQDLDYFISFPYVTITAKKYLDYTLPTQSIQIRLYGHTLSLEDINKSESRGFVNHGVLLRNNLYDIRDDKVMSIYVDGKLQDRSTIKFAEEDNTVRLNDPLNGLPFTIKEPYIAIKSIANTDTLPLYIENEDKNTRISQFFDIIFPEPDIDETNVISDHHYLYSPIVSKIIVDVLDGNISSSLYTNPYDDMDILNLIDNDPIYKRLLEIEPTKTSLPSNIAEVHPHIGNSTISMDLLQYRFITNVVRVITNNNPDKINLSGYLAITV